MNGMSEFQTIETLCAAKRISEDEVEACVEAFLSGAVAGPFAFRAGYRVNLLRAVRSHPGAREIVGRANVGLALKRPFVRAAILQARPLKD